MKNLEQRLNDAGYFDKEVEFNIIPQISDKAGSILREPVYPKGQRRSLLFRQPGKSIIVDTGNKEIWNADLLKRGKGISFLKMPPDEVMQKVAELEAQEA